MACEIRRILDEGTGSGRIEIKDQEFCLLLVLDALHRFIDPTAMVRDIDQTRIELNERAVRGLDLPQLFLEPVPEKSINFSGTGSTVSAALSFKALKFKVFNFHTTIFCSASALCPGVRETFSLA